MSNTPPSSCPTCLEEFKPTDKPLSCGHWIHISCIQKGHKAACHLCRAPLNIKVYGKLDDPIPPIVEHIDEHTRSSGYVSIEEEMDLEFLKQAYKIKKPDRITRLAILRAEERIRRGKFEVFDNEDDESSEEIDYPDESDEV